MNHVVILTDTLRATLRPPFCAQLLPPSRIQLRAESGICSVQVTFEAGRLLAIIRYQHERLLIRRLGVQATLGFSSTHVIVMLLHVLFLATAMASHMPPKIDVHSHFLPDFYQEACRKHGHANPDGMPYLPRWNVTSHLALMVCKVLNNTKRQQLRRPT